MNYIIYYFVIIVIYLGIARSSDQQYSSISSINKVSDLSQYLAQPPSTAILLSVEEQGVFIHSFYFQIKVINAFYESKKIYVRVPKPLAKEYAKYIGLSILSSSNENENLQDAFPSPPGISFLGNPLLGKWIYVEGLYIWNFYNAFDHLKEELGWFDFKPSNLFKEMYENARSRNEIFLGNINSYPLFGPRGIITRKMLRSTLNNNVYIKHHKNYSMLEQVFQLRTNER